MTESRSISVAVSAMVLRDIRFDEVGVFRTRSEGEVDDTWNGGWSSSKKRLRCEYRRLC